MYFLCGLCVTESDCGDILEDGHLHGAVTPIKEGDERSWVHRAIGDGAAWSRHCKRQHSALWLQSQPGCL